MNLLVNYIKGFLNRSGSYILIATLISRLLSFIGAWIALKMIDQKELGVILFAFGIVQFLIPMGGFGLNQGLIRFGALLKTPEEKKQLLSYVLKKGVIGSFLLILLIILTGYFVSFQFKNTYYYLVILSFAILTNFLFEIIKTKFRLEHQNKMYAKSEIVFSFIQTILIFFLCFFLKGIGYIISLIVAPLLTSLFFLSKVKVNLSSKISLDIINLTFWKYGFFASLSNVVTQFLFIVDILLIGYFLSNPEFVTTYRYVSIIPFSLLFLPRVFITTDFVSITENIYDKKYVNDYIKSYLLLFSIISIILITFSYFFSHQVLNIFQHDYYKYSDSFMILIIGITGVFILRNLFGNLLSSIGKANQNYYIVTIALVLNIIGNSYTIPEYGIKGAAITTSILMWMTGLASWILFKFYYKKLLLKKL